MKKFQYLLIIFLMFLFIDNTLAFDTNKKVYDYAQVLTDKQELKLKKNINLFVANNNLDLVIVIPKHHDKESTIKYADEFYNVNKFNKDGIICVVDFTFNDVNIEILTFGKAKQLYSNENIKKVLLSINKKQDKGYYKVLDTFIDKTDYFVEFNFKRSNSKLSYTVTRVLKLMSISFVLSSLCVLYCFIKNKMVKNNKIIKNYLIKDSFIINKKVEKFITTETKTKR